MEKMVANYMQNPAEYLANNPEPTTAFAKTGQQMLRYLSKKPSMHKAPSNNLSEVINKVMASQGPAFGSTVSVCSGGQGRARSIGGGALRGRGVAAGGVLCGCGPVGPLAPPHPDWRAAAFAPARGQGAGGWHKASVSGCLPLAAPIGLSPLLILTLCGPERVLVVSTEPPDDLSCLTRGGGRREVRAQCQTMLGQAQITIVIFRSFRIFRNFRNFWRFFLSFLALCCTVRLSSPPHCHCAPSPFPLPCPLCPFPIAFPAHNPFVACASVAVMFMWQAIFFPFRSLSPWAKRRERYPLPKKKDTGAKKSRPTNHIKGTVQTMKFRENGAHAVHTQCAHSAKF